MFNQCERCGESMDAENKTITQFGLINICGDKCYREVEYTECLDLKKVLPYRQVKSFKSKEDLKQCCESALEQSNGTGEIT